MPDETLIFLHAPKTAGTTLNRLLEREYNPTRIFTVDGSLIPLSLWRFRHLGERRRRRLQVVKGHMPFGLHELLPQPATYLTLLREPVDRMISTYFYIQQTPLHPFRRLAKRLSLRAFVESEPSRSNIQCKLLAGLPPFAPCNEKTLLLAKQHLEKYFRVVGLTDRFEESLILMREQFHWNLTAYTSYRRTANRPLRETLDSGTIEAVATMNRFDVELYKLATELFERQIASVGRNLCGEATALRETASKAPDHAFPRMLETIARAAVTKVCSTI